MNLQMKMPGLNLEFLTSRYFKNQVSMDFSFETTIVKLVNKAIFDSILPL